MKDKSSSLISKQIRFYYQSCYVQHSFSCSITASVNDFPCLLQAKKPNTYDLLYHFRPIMIFLITSIDAFNSSNS